MLTKRFTISRHFGSLRLPSSVIIQGCLVECSSGKCLNLNFSFHSDLAEQVLDHFQDKFTDEGS